MDRAFEEVDRRLPPTSWQNTALRPWPPTWAPLGPPHRAARLRTCAAQGDRERNVFATASTVDQMPKQVAVAHIFGSGLSVPIPDVDRTDYPDPRRQPARVERKPAHGARHARATAAHRRAGRQDRRGRSASQPDGGGIRRAPLHPPRDGCASSLRDRARPVRRGLVAPGRLEEHCNGIDEVEALARDFAPEAVAAACGVRPRRCGGWPATSRPRTGGRVRTDRNLHTGVRDAHELARGRDQRPHRNLDREGARCSRRPRPASRTRAASRDAAACAG